MNILMPMAGEGSRTKSRSELPKPLIPILGLPMFYWAISSANIEANRIFVIQQDHVGVMEAAAAMYPDSRVITQKGKVSGAVVSCLLAEDAIDESPLLIMDCDMRIKLNFNALVKDNPEIGVATFVNQSPNYSYVSDNGYIVEKKVVSNNAVAGSFYWRNGRDFVRYAKLAVEKGRSLNNEFYLSSAINEAVLGGLTLSSYPADSVYDLSTESGTGEFIDDFYS